MEQVIDIDEDTEPRLVEVGLQDAVNAVHRAVHAGINDLIVAAAVFLGAGAGFKKVAKISAEEQILFALG